MATSVNSSLDAYVKSTYMLVRSLSIKSVISAQRVNEAVIAEHGEDSVDKQNPFSWKYYMNISGQYHFTDQMMRVISLDTQEEIDFTVENLRKHTATAEAYKYGTRYYFLLLRQYPKQQQLILSVVNPCDLQKAVESPDGTILAYYKEYVESQENSLIHDLEKYIMAYLSRYTTQGYNNVWKNYPVLNMSNLIGSLPSQVMNLRLQACKTEKTHSFHIEQYLASHGRLDRFIPWMTYKQKLYLYHNIDHIVKFAGHTATFNELIQWILSDRQIPLSSYTVRQLQIHDSQLYPELRAHRTELGTLANTAESEYVDMESYFEKEAKTQRGNAEYLSRNKESILHSLATDNTSVIQTKDLESAMIDYTDAVPDTVPETLIRTWAYMSAKGMYNVLVNFDHPDTGEKVSLFAKDALIYYSYLMMTAMGYEPTYVPSFMNSKFRLHPRPPVELLYKDLLPNMFPDLKEIADRLISAQPILRECRSVSAFWDLAYQIYQENQVHWFLKANTSDPLKRGIIAKMCMKLFGIEDLQLVEGDVLMGEWLKSQSLDRFKGDPLDAIYLANIIFEAATGYSTDNTKSLRYIQRAMVEMFTQLSSYTIQVTHSINDSAIIPLNWAAIRVGFRGQNIQDEVNVTAPVRILESDAKLRDKAQVDDHGDYVEPILRPIIEPVRIEDPIFVHLDTSDGSVYRISASVNIPATRVSDESPGSGSQQDPFQPMTYYNQLSQEQINEIANFITKR